MEEAIMKGLEVLLGAVGALLLWLGAKLGQLITAKVKQAYLQGVLIRLTDVVLTAVKEVQQTLVNELKAASEDGRLDANDKEHLRDAALRTVKSYIGAKGLGELAKVLGFDPKQIDAFLGTRIEAAVHDLRAAEAQPAPPVPR